MWDVDSTWVNLTASDNFRYEYAIAIADESATQGFANHTLTDMSAEYRLFDAEQPAVGGCLAAELTASMLKPSTAIPRMARVRAFVRATDGTTHSGWVPQGVFYIDTREVTQNDDGRDVLTIHAYDAMLKAEADFPSTDISWPAKDYRVVQIIAHAMGLQSSSSASSHGGIDARTKALMNNGSGIYDIYLPAGYSMRETLSYIAAMYAGNWVMSYDGKLLLVPINSLPPETNYLIDRAGNAITFGGDRILV